MTEKRDILSTVFLRKARLSSLLFAAQSLPSSFLQLKQRSKIQSCDAVTVCFPRQLIFVRTMGLTFLRINSATAPEWKDDGTPDSLSLLV